MALLLTWVTACGEPEEAATTNPAPVATVQPAAPSVRTMDLLTEKHGWVLTDRSLATTEDGGDSWVDVTPPGLDAAHIRGAFFLSPQQGWVVASGSPNGLGETPVLALRTGDGGKTWVSAPMTPPHQDYTLSRGIPAYISFVDRDHGWVVVKMASSSNFSVGEIWRTEDGGDSWTELSIPIGGPITFVSPLAGWVAGGPSGDQLHITRDGGNTWAREDVTAPAEFTVAPPAYALPAVDDAGSITLAVTYSGEGGGGVAFYNSTGPGEAWSLERVVPLEGDVAFGLVAPHAAPGKNERTVLSPLGNVLYSFDTAGTKHVISPRGLPQVMQADFVTPLAGWALAWTGGCTGFKTGCTSGYGVFRTTDGGEVWSDITP